MHDQPSCTPATRRKRQGERKLETGVWDWKEARRKLTLLLLERAKYNAEPGGVDDTPPPESPGIISIGAGTAHKVWVGLGIVPLLCRVEESSVIKYMYKIVTVPFWRLFVFLLAILTGVCPVRTLWRSGSALPSLPVSLLGSLFWT